MPAQDFQHAAPQSRQGGVGVDLAQIQCHVVTTDLRTAFHVLFVVYAGEQLVQPSSQRCLEAGNLRLPAGDDVRRGRMLLEHVIEVIDQGRESAATGSSRRPRSAPRRRATSARTACSSWYRWKNFFSSIVFADHLCCRMAVRIAHIARADRRMSRRYCARSVGLAAAVGCGSVRPRAVLPGDLPRRA